MSNCNKNICSSQPSLVSWTSPANIAKAGFAYPYEMLVPDQCYCIRSLETIGVNSLNPKCGHCGCSDTLTIIGNTDICGNATISGKLTVAGLIDPTGLVLDAQASEPFTTTNKTKGGIWVDDCEGCLHYNAPNTTSTILITAVDKAVNDASINKLESNITTIDSSLNTHETDIKANTAKTGISSGQITAITENTATRMSMMAAITANTAKTGITSGQSAAITANTTKTGITSEQAAKITANATKTGITSGQAAAIVANSSKLTFPGFGTKAGTVLEGNTTIISDEQITTIDKNASDIKSLTARIVALEKFHAK